MTELAEAVNKLKFSDETDIQCAAVAGFVRNLLEIHLSKGKPAARDEEMAGLKGKIDAWINNNTRGRRKLGQRIDELFSQLRNNRGGPKEDD